MTRLRSSTFALRATVDKSSVGAPGLCLRSASVGGTRGASPRARRWISRACHAAAKQGRVLTTAVAVVIGGSSSVFACPVCFGADETSMIEGTQLGILVLLAITLAVQGAFAGFFFYLRNRAKRVADFDLDSEWSELQRGASRTS